MWGIGKRLRSFRDSLVVKREEVFIEGSALFVALRGLKGELRSSVTAKARLLSDLRRSSLEGPNRS